MTTIRFRNAAPVAVLMMLVSMTSFDAGGAGESRRPARRQAADGVGGAPKKQAAERVGGAPKRQAAERHAGAARARPAASAPADSAQASAPDSAAKSAVRADSTDGRMKPAKSGARAGAERDSSGKKAHAERDEPKEEPPVRGPRLPIWPGISLANPSAGHEKLAAAW
jgi:hypothetical protein